MTWPMPAAMAWVSSAQWVLIGAQNLLVNSVMAAAVIMTVLDFSRATCWTASGDGGDGQVGDGVHALVIPLTGDGAGDVGLVLGVGVDDLDGRPRTVGPKSAAAMRAAAMEPAPPLLA